MSIHRPRAIGDEDVKLVVREHYPISSARQKKGALQIDEIKDLITKAKTGDHLKKVFNPHVTYGASLIDHVFKEKGLQDKCLIGKTFNIEKDLDTLVEAFNMAEDILNDIMGGQTCKGYIIQKVEKSLSTTDAKEVITFKDFCPLLYKQFENEDIQEFESFDKAVDIYFSSLESQKIDMKTLQKEKEALKKLENIKKDHYQRISNLQKSQDEDCYKAQLIEMNLELVDQAILVLANAIVNQASWADIEELITEAQAQGDPVARMIKSLKLDINHFVIALTDPYDQSSSDDEDDDNYDPKKNAPKNSKHKPILVDIDLDLTAYANARKYYDKKRSAAKKEQKTIESSTKAYKSAEKKTKQTLKEVAVTAHIIKSRKTLWFEKFHWFISSENYLIIAGRDVQQNEQLVKRYLRPGDIYVHADLHGATSLIIKNPSKKPVPHKTLNEAGTMAICFSSAWDSKIITSAWWVYHHQVSKTAPTGEYLTTGSFMIRGKKNFLPPSYLILGYGFLFKLDEDSLERHKDERKVKMEEEQIKIEEEEEAEEAEIHVSDNSDDEEAAPEVNGQNIEPPTEEKPTPLETIQEMGDLKIEESSDHDDESDDSASNFPDTVVSLLPTVPSKKPQVMVAPEPVIVHESKQKRGGGKPQEAATNDKNKQPQQQQQQTKRGQKSKQKKMKDKYRNQDEEEREMRMKVLSSAGESKKAKKAKEKEQQAGKSKQHQNRIKNKAPAGICIHTEAEPVEEPKKEEDEDSDQEVLEEKETREDDKLLNSLTGCPVPDDTLMYALPVCAPYSCLLNYKYKVKVMPGTAKRGKAAKRALQMFIQDRATTQREKDLLKSVKDQDIYRNLPGKVKLAAPNLCKVKPRAIGDEDVKLVVREHYPISSARQKRGALQIDEIKDLITKAKTGDHLKKVFNPHVTYGASLIDHVFKEKGLQDKCLIGKTFNIEKDLDTLVEAFNKAEDILNDIMGGQTCKGYIIQKVEKSLSTTDAKEVITFKDFCPLLYKQFENEDIQEFESFDKAVDIYFSSLESQKIDMKTLQKEKEALKKLENIKKDHYQRISNLQKSQDEDCYKAQLIEMNLELVDQAILVLANAIVNQASWADIEELITEAQAQGNPVARMIKSLKLDINHFVIALTDPYDQSSSDDEDDDNYDPKKNAPKNSKHKPILVDIDLDLTAYANARKYYDKKRSAAKKEQKTIESSTKAYKSAEKKTKQTLKEVAVTAHIIKSRKTLWFEKFHWFISSENYLIIAGRDVQQNEQLVKRYLRPGDIYVHADLHGATSLIIKNPSKKPVPHKTLNEAGTMAICFSSAWDSKIITSAWWVYHHQVSKTALQESYGFLFKLDEDSLERHKDERKVKMEEEQIKIEEEEEGEEAEIHVSDNSDDEEAAPEVNGQNIEPPTEEKPTPLETIQEMGDLKIEESSDHDDESDDSAGNFPDTVVSLLPTVPSKKPQVMVAPEPVIVHESKQKRGGGKPQEAATNDKNKQPQQQQQQQTKRGQKSKQKKMKDKYRNQDEEEREMRMKVLSSAGESKKAKKAKEKEQQAGKSKQHQNRIKNKAPAGICIHTEAEPVEEPKKEEDEDSDQEVLEEKETREDDKLLNSLTGCPVPDDTLMYALPVCAPYSCLLNYKYKVKVMPGTAKRGKAAKRALQMFIQDRATTQREKDLLKSVKDQDIYRNLPGKVKLAAPNLCKVK
ncbi:NEMF [Cordylochernes scorpioides]|uniref:NEMF n=1 Tax=Cordylochernes scorpioides TaxID=51811 RepID=A0ABY6KUR3_9ARAC|nr:NEMF [Cordylochernes scorpioides]